METAKIVRNTPVNGIDVSHWNGISPEPVPEWVKYYGIKAAHLGGTKMVDGIDPLFQYNRKRARFTPTVRWIGMYLYLTADTPMVDQINTLIHAVGDLQKREFVFLDWEDPELTVLDPEAMYYLESIYSNRWAMYVNDMTPSMNVWMERNRTTPDSIPVIHPNWSPEGWAEAQKWEASVWQAGVGQVDGYENCIDVNLVTLPDKLDRIT
jgi:GH25 family lysozyme M1 (1,4-beta-N-acetylmuramidase)